MEYWDLYDKHRRLTGRRVRRGEPIAPGYYHAVVHLALFRSDAQLLIQRRHPDKEIWGGYWDLSVGGSVLSGESPQAAMERETREEIGVKLAFADERPVLTVNFERGFDDYFLYTADIPLKEMKPQPEEVTELKWVSRDELFALHRDGRFLPYHDAHLALLFAMQHYQRALKEPSDW